MVLTACGGGTVAVQYRGMPDMAVETKPLPDRPDKTPIADGKDYVVPLSNGDKAPADGVLLSPDKAARVKLWQLDYDELRALYNTDREVWKQTRIVYEERLGQANEEIRRLQPSWWDQHRLEIGVVTGIIGGVAIMVGAYKLEQVVK